MMDGLQYTFSDIIKQWLGSKSTWHYVSLPTAMSDEIHTLSQYHQTKRRGWGAVKVEVSMGDQQWQTSIFPAFEGKRYALFLKADVRKQLAVTVGSEVSVSLTVLF
ncbi:DUF1905 domain-containing protein [Methylophilus sp. OH31]|uniref:DUF1905 domain-containing protein n=1 Tax=Methylophilus sp. OH31 TaxID=1387312 RepID=UPI0004639CB4|nr:DUF1905 domain-containing protein [Methylophilus sp. OH31]